MLPQNPEVDESSAAMYAAISIENGGISRETNMRCVAKLFLCIILGLLFIPACSKQPVRVNMMVNAESNINQDAGGQPLSVIVRVYQLKDKGRLESADYNAILKSDTQALAGDLLENQERILKPGAQEIMEIRANPAANYLGIVALFRNPSGDKWRRIIPILGKSQKLTVSLREASIDVVSSGK
jgi:type VI secretion system protein VasD